jgi:hypothetical protein
MMAGEISAMEITTTATNALEAAASPVEPDPSAAPPDEAEFNDPLEDSDLRALDVTAGEPD